MYKEIRFLTISYRRTGSDQGYIHLEIRFLTNSYRTGFDQGYIRYGNTHSTRTHTERLVCLAFTHDQGYAFKDILFLTNSYRLGYSFKIFVQDGSHKTILTVRIN